jgi:hypothetical protein
LSENWATPSNTHVIVDMDPDSQPSHFGSPIFSKTHRKIISSTSLDGSGLATPQECQQLIDSQDTAMNATAISGVAQSMPINQ